jgi:hypothetical protein
LAESHEAEKPRSRSGDVLGPHVVIDSWREEGGVCKAERAALGALEDAEASPVLSSKPLSMLLATPIAGDAEGVKW